MDSMTSQQPPLLEEQRSTILKPTDRTLTTSHTQKNLLLNPKTHSTTKSSSVNRSRMEEKVWGKGSASDTTTPMKSILNSRNLREELD